MLVKDCETFSGEHWYKMDLRVSIVLRLLMPTLLVIAVGWAEAHAAASLLH